MDFKFSYNDIVIAIIFILCVFGGIFSGLIRKIGNKLSWIGGLAGTIAFTPIIFKLALDNNWFGDVMTNQIYYYLILAGFYIVIYLIGFGVIKLVFKLIENVSDAVGILNVINKIFGGLYGIVAGFIVSALYLLAIYGVAQVNEVAKEWMLNDFGYNGNLMSCSRFILDMTLNIFTGIKDSVIK